jgi:hypothetical protein
VDGVGSEEDDSTELVKVVIVEDDSDARIVEDVGITISVDKRARVIVGRALFNAEELTISLDKSVVLDVGMATASLERRVLGAYVEDALFEEDELTTSVDGTEDTATDEVDEVDDRAGDEVDVENTKSDEAVEDEITVGEVGRTDTPEVFVSALEAEELAALLVVEELNTEELTDEAEEEGVQKLAVYELATVLVPNDSITTEELAEETEDETTEEPADETEGGVTEKPGEDEDATEDVWTSGETPSTT